eukprot:9552682-Lingulodinium_polyedra.AAC.1
MLAIQLATGRGLKRRRGLAIRRVRLHLRNRKRRRLQQRGMGNVAALSCNAPANWVVLNETVTM